MPFCFCAREAIHEFFTKLQVTGFGPEKRKFEFGELRPALICGDLALTSTRSRDGNVTSEVARRQKDGTWPWVIDRYSDSWWLTVYAHVHSEAEKARQLLNKRRLLNEKWCTYTALRARDSSLT